MMLAKIAAWQRLPRLLMIWVMVCMVYFIATRLVWTRDWTTQINTGARSKLGLGNSAPSDTVMFNGIIENNQIWENAHKLPGADYFLSHFNLLTKMKGMTMAEAKAGCTWGKYDQVNYQYPGDKAWVVSERTDREIETQRREWHKFIETELLPWQHYKDRFSGRGIVMVGGNELSIARFNVLLKALKKLGSQIPIELHYWDYEMNDEKKRNLTDLWPWLTFNDLSNPDTNIILTHDHTPLINYQYKTVAFLNSRFEEALLMDSDNIPVIDPMELFESETYKEYGSVFWPDIARTRPQNPVWAISNTACRMDEFEQESGQMLVDKRRFWYHLQLTTWLNDNKGGYYNQFLLGDKDMYRFTWHALKTKYGKPKKWLTSVGTLNGDFFCGHTFAQYHPDNDKVAFLHGGLLKTMTQEVWNYQYDHGGVWQVYKRADSDEDHMINIDVTIKWDPAEYLPNRPDNIRAGWCTEMKDVEAKPLDDILPNFDETFREIGGYWEKDFPDYP